MKFITIRIFLSILTSYLFFKAIISFGKISEIYNEPLEQLLMGITFISIVITYSLLMALFFHEKKETTNGTN